MPPIVLENNKKPGVCYAVTDDGLELPVIDVSHPAFAFDVGEPALTTAINDTLEDLARFKAMTPDQIRTLAQESILLRGGLQARGGFMSGITTYLHKVGPDNLGRGYASDWDRRAASQLLPLAFRHRLATVARLLADCLLAVPGATSDPIHLFNIGGGTALDSINALILAQRDRPGLLDRAIAIHVLDLDSAGPSFGDRALKALQSAHGPLENVRVEFEHIPYDWAYPAALAIALDEARRDGAVLIGSSEGGLFEYGSDDDIVVNLKTLADHAPDSFKFVGALLKDQATLPERLKWIGKASGISVRLLGLAALQQLAGKAGWRIERIEEDRFTTWQSSAKADLAVDGPSRI